MAGFPAMNDNVSRNKHINFYRHIKINLSYLMTAPLLLYKFYSEQFEAETSHLCLYYTSPKKEV